MFKELLQVQDQSVSLLNVNKSHQLFLQTFKMLNMTDRLTSVINVQCILYLMGERVFCTIIKIYYVNSDIPLVCFLFTKPSSGKMSTSIVI